MVRHSQVFQGQLSVHVCFNSDHFLHLCHLRWFSSPPDRRRYLLHSLALLYPG